MLRNIAKFEEVINGRSYNFLCELDAPLPDCKEYLFHCIKHIGLIEDQIKANQEKLKAEAEASAQAIPAPEVIEVPNPTAG